MTSRRNRTRCNGAFDNLESRRLLSLVLSPINITASQDAPFSNVVATLVDTDRTASPSDFNDPPGSVQVNWGDGVTTSGLVVGPISPGVFYVDASHTYTTSNIFSTLISVNDQSGNSANATGLATVTASVSPPELTIAANTIKGSAGTALTGVPVATFLDPDPSDIASNFQALITWGNGNTSIGLIQGGNGAFTVYGTNTYGAQGTFTTNITVVSTNNGLDGFATGTAKIGPSSLYGLTGQQFTANAGASFSTTVATFTDATLTDTPSDFSATIAWGDGQTSQGTVTGGSGKFSIIGSHVYAEPGTEAVTVTLVDQQNHSSFTTSTANVTGPVLTPQATTFMPSLSEPFTGIVGSFFDTDPSDNPSNLTATITWGDGHISTGTIVPQPNIPGYFEVQGTNTYTVAGTYAVNIVIANTSNQSTTIASTATVAAATFVATGTSFPATPGVPTPTSTVVANVIDTNPNATATSLTAVINWGDGTATTTGTVNATSSPDSFTVTGAHTYASPSASGSYNVTVTIGDPNGPSTMATSNAYVGSPLAASGTNDSATAGVALPANTVVANLIDTNTSASAQTIIALINWGDGQTSQGTVNSTAVRGVYTVTGGHTYTGPGVAGSYPVTVNISDPDGPTVKATGTAIIVPPLTGNGTLFVTTPGVPVGSSTILATFIDTNPVANANPPSIQATINWGDGQTSVGTVTPTGGTLAQMTYKVTGFHNYSPVTTASSFKVTVTINDPSQQQLSVTSTAIVKQYISATNTTFSATVGQQLANVKVASFSDSNPSANDTNITAVINWGDGQTSVGSVTSAGGDNYTVTGSHIYASSGVLGLFPILVTIVDLSGENTSVVSAAILAAPMSATGLNFTATVGQSFTNQPVATFYDANSNDAAGATAVINWGDGQSTLGTIDAYGPSGFYVVKGSHTYSSTNAKNSFAVGVTIDDSGGQTATTSGTATVAAPTIAATGTTFSTYQAALGAIVANFTDSNSAATATTIKAVINWGDGFSVVGSVEGADGVYTVSGIHPYAIPSKKGSYAVTVTIVDPSGQTATVTSTALVVTPALSAVPLVVNFTEGTPPSSPVIVGYFFDTNASATASSFTASINWNTGQSSPGTVTASSAAPGLFAITGTYLYPAAGTYNIAIAVEDNQGNSTVIPSAAIVAPNVSLVTPNFAFTGELAPNAGNGNYVASGYTNTNRPTFSGTAVPFAIVQLYGMYWGVDAVQPLGEAVTNANGQWTLPVGPLATGTYTITATVTPPGGYPLAASLTNNGIFYIDMTPPRPKLVLHREQQKHVASKPAPSRLRALKVHKSVRPRVADR
jgi:hypothetical protein